MVYGPNLAIISCKFDMVLKNKTSPQNTKTRTPIVIFSKVTKETQRIVHPKITGITYKILTHAL